MSDKESAKLSYQPKCYWEEREHPNTAADPGLSKLDIEYLSPRVQNVNSVLEIGPGVGRLFKLYKNTPIVKTLDLSRNFAERASAVAAENGINVKQWFREDAAEPFPFREREFELGVFSHVLQHVPFEFIDFTMAEAARCCAQVVVIGVRERHWPKSNSRFDAHWHCFDHDFEEIAKRRQFEIYNKVVKRIDDPYSPFAFTYRFAGAER